MNSEVGGGEREGAAWALILMLSLYLRRRYDLLYKIGLRERGFGIKENKLSGELAKHRCVWRNGT